MLCVKNNDEWNYHIATLFEKIEISRILHSIFDTDKTIRQLSSFLFSVCLIADDKLTLSNFQQIFDSNFACSNHVKTVLDLPISELLVLLSIYKQMRSNKQQAWQGGRLIQNSRKNNCFSWFEKR